MPKSTQQLEDKIRLARVINWQRSLDGFTEEAIKPLQRAIDQASNEIMSRLEHWAEHPTDTGFSEERMLAVLRELDSMTGGIQAYLTGHIADMAGHSGSTSLDTWSNMLSWDGRVANFNFVALTAAQVRELAIETPVGGRLLADWVSRTFDENMVEGIRREIMAGMLKGEGYPALVDRIAQGWDMTRNDAVTLARTYVQSANVGAMDSVYKANQDIVKGWKWCATLEVGGKKGGGTCMQCAALDGHEYPLNGGPPCPLHCRCRCVKLPVTKTWRELGLNIDEMDAVYRPWTTSEHIIDVGRAAHPPEMMGFHQGAFADLFPKLPESDQLAMIGPGRLGLIQEGKITFADLVDPETGRLRLLEGKPGAWTGLKGFGGPEGIGGLGMGGEVKSLTKIEEVISGIKEKATLDDVKSLGRAWKEDNADLLKKWEMEPAQFKKNQIGEEIIERLKQGKIGNLDDTKFLEIKIPSKASQAKVMEIVDDIKKLTGSDIDTLKYIEWQKNIRPYANKLNNEIVISKVDRATLFHEIGHHVEFSEDWQNICRQYRGSRKIDDLGIRSLKSFFKSFGGKYDEMGFNTDLISKYCGKVYKDGSTEILSVALEYLSGGNKIGALMKNDPDLFEFLVGILQAKKNGLLL